MKRSREIREGAAPQWRRLLRAGWIAAALAWLAPATPAHAADPPRRIVLVTLEGAAGDRLPAMPGLEALTSGTPALSAHSPAREVFPATVAVLTGRAPASTRVADEWSRGAPADGPTLAGVLARAGYRGIALPADPLLHAGTRINRGFERFSPGSPALAESARVDTALDWLGQRGRRFAWIALAEGPALEVWRREDGPAPRSDSARAGRWAQVDAALGRLQRGLAAMDGGAVVVVAGTGGAPPRGSAADFEVPLRISRAMPDGGGPASLLDVAPTLAEIAGARPAGFDGRSLLSGRGTAPALPPPAEDSASAACRRLLRAWVERPPGRLDSLALLAAVKLRQSCPASARHAIEEAVTLSAAGVDDGAAHLFLEAQKRFPGDHRIAIAYADHLLRHGHFALVPNALGGIPADSPLASPGAWREALAATAELDFPAARRASERAAAMSVPAPFAGAAPAIARLERLKARVDADGNDAAARIEYGTALVDFGVREEGFAQLNRARMVDSTRAGADLAIAAILMREGRAAQAGKALERALAREPRNHAARLAYAEALAAAGEFAAAAPQFRIALQQRPDDARTHYNLACVLALAGEVREALASLERALDAGYRDWARIGSDPDLERVRALPEFAALERARRPAPR